MSVNARSCLIMLMDGQVGPLGVGPRTSGLGDRRSSCLSYGPRSPAGYEHMQRGYFPDLGSPDRPREASISHLWPSLRSESNRPCLLTGEALCHQSEAKAHVGNRTQSASVPGKPSVLSADVLANLANLNSLEENRTLAARFRRPSANIPLARRCYRP